MRAEQVSSWQKGTEGEDRFEAALYGNAEFRQWFKWLRNMRMQFNQRDLLSMGLNMTEEYYNARFNTQGDLDFVLFGPTGVFLIDVKNWDSTAGFGEVWTERIDKMGEMLSWQRDFLRVKLEDALEPMGLDVTAAIVMAGKQQPYETAGEFPIYSIEEAIAVMNDSKIVMDPDTSWMVHELAMAVTVPAG